MKFCPLKSLKISGLLSQVVVLLVLPTDVQKEVCYTKKWRKDVLNEKNYRTS